MDVGLGRRGFRGCQSSCRSTANVVGGRRRGSRVGGYTGALLALLAVAAPSVASGADVELAIDMEVLDALARTAGPATGADRYAGQKLKGRPGLVLPPCPPQLAPCAKDLQWTWQAHGAHFVVANGEVRLRGELLAFGGGSSFVSGLDLPVTVRFAADTSELVVEVGGAPIDVTLGFRGSAVTVGRIAVGPCFSGRLSLPVPQANLGGGSPIVASYSSAQVNVEPAGLRVLLSLRVSR